MTQKRRNRGRFYRLIFCLFLMIPSIVRAVPERPGDADRKRSSSLLNNELTVSELSPSTVAAPLQQDSRLLTGHVSDSKTGEPVIGAAIQAQGRTDGVVTDINGDFTMTVLDNYVLTVSSLGYVSQTVQVGTQTRLTIQLVPDTELLDEVVVTAFGVGQKKESLVGSVQLVRPESLEVPAANLSTAFAGRLAGVVSYQRSGMPGQNGSDFYIRGISTISGVTSPLIILDGVEISNAHGRNQREQLDFTRPECSRLLSAPAFATNAAGRAEALAIIVAGRDRLAKTPRCDMEGFAPCETDCRREERYQRRLEAERNVYKAISEGREVFDKREEK
mgnify:CR=1 FL=1